MSRLLPFLINLICGASITLARQDPPKYRVLAQDKGHVVIVSPNGQVEWETPCNFMAHELTLLPNGNFLINTGPATLVEMTPQKQVVWSWEGKPVAPYAGKVEIHGAQRLENGVTIVA